MRPKYCCGVCPETVSGVIDCTCRNNSRCFIKKLEQIGDKEALYLFKEMFDYYDDDL